MSDARIAPWRPWWEARAPRERLLILAGLAAVGVLVVWLAAVQPAWRTLKQAPAQLDALDAQWQDMQRLATETRELRALAPVSREQSVEALQATVARLGDQAKLVQQGDRVVVTLTNLPSSALREALLEMRHAARARPVEATLTRTAQGFSGPLVLALPGGTP